MALRRDRLARITARAREGDFREAKERGVGAHGGGVQVAGKVSFRSRTGRGSASRRTGLVSKGGDEGVQLSFVYHTSSRLLFRILVRMFDSIAMALSLRNTRMMQSVRFAIYLDRKCEEPYPVASVATYDEPGRA